MKPIKLLEKREIKFRPWDYEHEIMTYSPVNKINFAGQIHLHKGWEDLKNTCYILMQFTGLKDKKGREIYEGDIIGLEATANASVGEVGGPATDSASASVDTDMQTDATPVTLSAISRGISPKGASWVAENGNRVRIDRDLGRVVANEMRVEDTGSSNYADLIVEDGKLVVVWDDETTTTILSNR